MADITINGRPVDNAEDQELLRRILDAFPGAHNGDNDIDAAEALRIMDADQNGFVDEQDLLKNLDLGLTADGFNRTYRLFSGTAPSLYKYSTAQAGKLLLEMAEKDPRKVLEYAALYKDQPYAEEAIRTAANKDPRSALIYANNYIDQPYAEEVIKTAAEDHPETALEYVHHYIGEPYAAEVMALAKLRLEDKYGSWSALRFVNYGWDDVSSKYSGELGGFFSDDELRTFEDFKTALKERYDIEFLGRFQSMETLIRVLELRSDPSKAAGRTAIIIYPKSDWNGILSGDNIIDLAARIGFDVIYYEVDNEKDTKKALEEATMGGRHKADLLIIGGHGSSTSLSLGDVDPAHGSGMSYEELNIDISDFTEGRDDLQLSRFINPGGDLVLNSCSNGAGGADNPDNLANTISRTVDGITITSATSRLRDMVIVLEGNQLKIRMIFSDTYIIKK